MKCREFELKAALLAEGEAETAETAALEAHAAECAACGASYGRSQHFIADLKSALHSPAVVKDDARIRDIMSIITNMPVPQSPAREKSMVFSICYTLYNSLAVGLMCAVVYFVVFSSFFTTEQIMLLPEARTALFGSISIIIGCIFVLLPGRSFTAWAVSRIRQSAARVQLAADNAIMVLAGLSFCVSGGILFFSGIL
ncbi:hypothetical protein ACFL4W_03605 [Planctomycetota bacterium]